MTNPDTPAPAVEAMIARLREPTNVCGACGQPWTGDKCGQVDNSWGFPTCYPHNEINLEEAADMLAAQAAEIERLTRERNAAREALAKAERLLDWCKMRLREPYRDLFDKYRKHPPEHDPDAPPLVISECDSARALIAKGGGDEQ